MRPRALGQFTRRHDRLRPAGVERQVGDGLDQLGLGEAVLLGEAQMIPELLKAARGDQGRDRDQTPRASSTRSVPKWSAIDQPTIRREKLSSTTAS